MKKNIVLIFFVFFLAFGASASTLVAPHSGGGVSSESGASRFGTTVWTILAQPFAGIQTSGASKGLFGAIFFDEIYSTSEGEDNGLIQKTVIERVGDAKGSDIRIRFRAGASNITAANIFRLSGVGTEIGMDGWQLVAHDIPVSMSQDTEWLESTVASKITKISVGDGANAYYLVVPSYVDEASDATAGSQSGAPYNARVVGKVDVKISGGNKWSLFSVPFVNVSSDLNALLGNQGALTEGVSPSSSVMIYSFRDGGFNNGSYYSPSKKQWLNLPNLPLAQWDGNKGLYILTTEKDKDFYLTLVGEIRIPSKTTNYTIDPDWNLIGFPYANRVEISKLKFDFAVANSNKDLSDMMFAFKDGGFNFGSYYNAQKKWADFSLGVPGVTVLEIASPLYYIYRGKNSTKWNMQLVY